MRKLLTALALTASIISASAASPIVSEIADFVYPANYCPTGAISNFMPDDSGYLAANADNTKIVLYDIASGNEISTVFDASHTRENSIKSFDHFIISPDGSRLLIATDVSSVYRRSSTAKYYTFDIKRNILRPLSRECDRQQAPLFSPDSRMVAFVADNNIKLRKLDYDTEIFVTDDGEAGKIINGIPDWVYEEEFTTNSLMAWSGDSSVLAFITSDETDVPTYSFPLYRGACHPMEEYTLYPGSFSYKYPVAGEPNSSVSLKSYDVATRKIVEINFGDKSPYYIPRIEFAPGTSTLLVTTLDRSQTRLEIYSANPKSTVTKSILVEQADCWIDPIAYENLVVSPTSFILNSSRSGYKHLYEYSLTGSLLRQITDGQAEVTACYGIDKDGNIYYQMAAPTPLDRTVYCLNSKGKTNIIGKESGFTTAAFSPSLNYCVTTHSDITTPPVSTLSHSNGKQLRQLSDNATFTSKVSSLPEKKLITINSDGVILNAWLMLPPNFDSGAKYPLIMTQYSGPGSQSVLNRWALDWEQFAATKGFIVASVDPRGTANRGREFMDVVYRNLGYYETIDQINSANYFASLPYVDSERIGICGWSYGGYEALMCATQPANPFKVAVAIAPVTDWRFYDTIYAERYMLTPQENHDGYQASAPLNRTRNLSTRLLLMHGTADDNVHLQNTLEFVSQLQLDGTLCDMLLFPNMNHSINGCNSRAVVYGNMMQYFINNL